jgi:hypothetical protein
MTYSTENRQQNLTDLFTTALEGGIGYWSLAYAYRWDCPWEARHALLAPCADGDTAEDWRTIGVTMKTHAIGPDETVEVAVLTPAMMGTGLAKLAKASPDRRTACGTTFGALSRLIGSDDFPDYDAGDADTIAQWALGLTSTWADGRRVEIYG